MHLPFKELICVGTPRDRPIVTFSNLHWVQRKPSLGEVMKQLEDACSP